MIVKRYPLVYYCALIVVAVHAVLYFTIISEFFLTGAVKLALFLCATLAFCLVWASHRVKRYHHSLLTQRPEIRNIRLLSFELWPETISQVDSDKSDFR